MRESRADDLRRELEETRNRLASGTARLDQLESRVSELESTAVRFDAARADRAARFERRRALLTLTGAGVLMLGLSIVTFGRVVPSLVVLATVIAIAAAVPSSGAQRPYLLSGIGAGFASAILGLPIGFPTGLVLAAAGMLAALRIVMPHAAVRSLWPLGRSFRLAANLLMTRAPALKTPAGPLWLSAVVLAGYAAAQFEDYFAVIVAAALGITYLGTLAYGARRLTAKVVVLMVLCSTSTVVYGAVRTNIIAPVRVAELPRELASRYQRIETRPPSRYDQLCGTHSPGAGAPKAQAGMIETVWRNTGATIAGCPERAVPVSSHRDTFVVRGQCNDGEISSLAVATSTSAALLLGQPARFALALAANGTLLGASNRFPVGTGDAYIIRSTAGSWVFVRRSLTSNPTRASTSVASCGASQQGAPYVKLSPALSAGWLHLVQQRGWTWPRRSVNGRYEFVGANQTVVATARCESLKSCRMTDRASRRTTIAHPSSLDASDIRRYAS